MDMVDRIKKLAYTVKMAQEMTGAGTAPGAAVSPSGSGMPPSSALGMPPSGVEAGEPADMPEEDLNKLPDAEEGEGDKKELDKPTPWIVKYDQKNKNFWIGKVFPDEYIDQAIQFFAQRKSVPKEQVREYLEKLMEGGDAAMPKEMAEAPETGEEGGMPGGEDLNAMMGGGAPAAPAGGMTAPGGMPPKPM